MRLFLSAAGLFVANTAFELAAAPWGTAFAQGPPQMEGVRVALLGAASDPAFNQDVVEQLMLATRGMGMPDDFVQPYPVTAGSLPGVQYTPVARPGYELDRIDSFDVAT